MRRVLATLEIKEIVSFGIKLIGDDISRISTIRMAKHFFSLYWAMSYQLK